MSEDIYFVRVWLLRPHIANPITGSTTNKINHERNCLSLQISFRLARRQTMRRRPVGLSTSYKRERRAPRCFWSARADIWVLGALQCLPRSLCGGGKWDVIVLNGPDARKAARFIESAAPDQFLRLIPAVYTFNCPYRPPGPPPTGDARDVSEQFDSRVRLN